MPRMLQLLAMLAVTAGAVWFLWPRPDMEIRIGDDGVARVVSRFGTDREIGDTVFVGGSGVRALRVVNEDTVTHRLAMFTVPAQGSLDYRVPPGVYGGLCTAHPTTTSITFIAR